MLPFELIQLVPDLAASTIFSIAVKRYIEKRAMPKVEEIANKEAEKIAEKLDKASYTQTGISAAAKTINNVKNSVKKSRELDPITKKKYCNLLRYLYDKYEDDHLLEVMLNNGCITEEEIKQLEEFIKLDNDEDGI